MTYAKPDPNRLKEDVVRAARSLFDSGVIQHSGHDNISACPVLAPHVKGPG